jgi:hypothetical protein
MRSDIETLHHCGAAAAMPPRVPVGHAGAAAREKVDTPAAVLSGAAPRAQANAAAK